MKFRAFFISFLCLLSLDSWSQNTFTLSGTITDADNGETLIGATVFLPVLSRGTTTNEYGYYALSIPEGSDSLTIEFSYIGFQKEIRQIVPEKDVVLNIDLGSGLQLEEVVVKADSYKEQLRSTEMSVEAITTKETKLIPVLLGESDIIKAIQLKPGIPSGAEGTTGLYVRGGSSDQNLIVLDEAIVYNASHLFGFFSTFNTDAVKDLKLYKGGFPAQYGGRLSSVIDVKLKEGNNREFAGTGGIGLIASRLTLEGPIQKEKSSFIVSGRRTYFDLITKGINNANSDNGDFNPIPDYYFYDLNTKVNFKLSEKDHLYLSGYFGRDKFGFNSDLFNFNFDWGNATGTARWNHVFGPRIFANTTFTYSDYQYNISNEVTGFSFEIGSNIKDANFKTDLYFAPSEKHTLRMGLAATYHMFTVGRLKAGSDDGEVSFSAGQDFTGAEFGLYTSDEWKLNTKLTVNYGLRLSAFANDGTSYFRLEPRLAANYEATERLSVKLSYARMNQYLHLVSSSGVALPTDVWYPSTQKIAPQQSDQIATGFSVLLGDKFFLTNEYFYKRLRNQLDFVDGAELFANPNLEEEFAIGKGYSYGMELSIEKKEGKLTGWIGYTLSLIRRGEFQPIDPGAVFAGREAYYSPRYDRRHDLSTVLMYEINRRLTASAAWVFGSGDLYWLPLQRFIVQDVTGAQSQVLVPLYEDRNNVRLAPYHRLDLGLVWKFFPKWGESDLTFNVVNTYDRRNAFFIYIEPVYAEGSSGNGTGVEIPERLAVKQVSLFPVLPSITWNFKF
ncbi:MAG: TonB-dependent receptor [Saprospiraceae bacterium]|nr:TonB-dependent receptor [Saprospiraceae bacterium]